MLPLFAAEAAPEGGPQPGVMPGLGVAMTGTLQNTFAGDLLVLQVCGIKLLELLQIENLIEMLK